MLSGRFLRSGDPHSPQKERSQVPPGSMALSVKVRRLGGVGGKLELLEGVG